ncbi:alpha/beta fold hydrolase [Acinetobacter pragensis]|uniref:AB hydrolase-1 domain-containing protein n=1 Tax=Acinetobacter pragensis TaxID=1806892 RepID=A0A151Y3W8_9GAMM|nr:alpha/beta hydrolase [Acinetobacter pragensis]KYQ72735.1 hypothetical protein AZH43_07710 [Acinetobacter pragensis]
MTIWTDLLGAEVRFHNAGGWRTRAIQAGNEGPAIILMHGVSGHADGFCKNVMPLANAGFRIYAIDAIGHGLSDKPEDVVYECPLYVEHLKRFMDANNIDKAFFVGQSLGGWTAMSFAHQYPDRVLGIVSLTGAGLRLSDPESEAIVQKVVQGVADVTKKATDAPTRESVRKRLEWLMADNNDVTDELVEVRYRYFTSEEGLRIMPKIARETIGEGNNRWMLTEDILKSLQTKILFLWTDQNPSMPAHIAEKASKIVPHGEYTVVEPAGHWAHFEQPEKVNKILIEWFKNV